MGDLAAMVARALVSAAAIKGVAPEKVFDPAPMGRGGARLLAALWLEKRIGRAVAMRVCRIGSANQLARSQWAKQGVVDAELRAMALAMAKLGMGEADPEPPPRANMPRPMVCDTPPATRHTPDGPVLPANRASRRVGKPAPRRADPLVDEHGRNPADIAADGHERRFVMERRSRAPPMPWAQIALQLGKCELDLRRVYDPGFASAAIASVADAGRVADNIVRLYGEVRPARVAPGTEEARILALIDGTRGAFDIGQLIVRETKAVQVIIGNLRRKGLIAPPGGGFPTLTDAGRQQMERLRG